MIGSECQVCFSTAASKLHYNELISCNRCGKTAHRFCYLPSCPTTTFQCDSCVQSPDARCCVCQNPGLLKSINSPYSLDSLRYAHPVCALFSNDFMVVSYHELTFYEVAQERIKQEQRVCNFCNIRSGGVILCRQDCEQKAHNYCSFKHYTNAEGEDWKPWLRLFDQNMHSSYELLLNRMLNPLLPKVARKSCSRDKVREIKRLSPLCKRHQIQLECICGQLDLSKTRDWVFCDQCYRWYHKECLLAKESGEDHLDDSPYICPFCRQWAQCVRKDTMRELTHYPRLQVYDIVFVQQHYERRRYQMQAKEQLFLFRLQLFPSQVYLECRFGPEELLPRLKTLIGFEELINRFKQFQGKKSIARIFANSRQKLTMIRIALKNTIFRSGSSKDNALDEYQQSWNLLCEFQRKFHTGTYFKQLQQVKEVDHRDPSKQLKILLTEFANKMKQLTTIQESVSCIQELTRKLCQDAKTCEHLLFCFKRQSQKRFFQSSLILTGKPNDLQNYLELCRDITQLLGRQDGLQKTAQSVDKSYQLILKRLTLTSDNVRFQMRKWTKELALLGKLGTLKILPRIYSLYVIPPLNKLTLDSLNEFINLAPTQLHLQMQVELMPLRITLKTLKILEFRESDQQSVKNKILLLSSIEPKEVSSQCSLLFQQYLDMYSSMKNFLDKFASSKNQRLLERFGTIKFQTKDVDNFVVQDLKFLKTFEVAVLGNFSTDLFRTLKEHLEWLSTLLSRRPVIFDSWVNYQLVQNLKKQLNANLPQRMLSVLLAGENIRGQLLSCYANFDYPETIVNTEKVLSSLQQSYRSKEFLFCQKRLEWYALWIRTYRILLNSIPPKELLQQREAALLSNNLETIVYSQWEKYYKILCETQFPNSHFLHSCERIHQRCSQLFKRIESLSRAQLWDMQISKIESIDYHTLEKVPLSSVETLLAQLHAERAIYFGVQQLEIQLILDHYRGSAIKASYLLSNVPNQMSSQWLEDVKLCELEFIRSPICFPDYHSLVELASKPIKKILPSINSPDQQLTSVDLRRILDQIIQGNPRFPYQNAEHLLTTVKFDRSVSQSQATIFLQQFSTSLLSFRQFLGECSPIISKFLRNEVFTSQQIQHLSLLMRKYSSMAFQHADLDNLQIHLLIYLRYKSQCFSMNPPKQLNSQTGANSRTQTYSQAITVTLSFSFQGLLSLRN